jgi:AhpD family alkylhydroperoxidase
VANPAQELDDFVADFETYKGLQPNIGQIYQQMPTEAHKDGVLSAKTKRLMALSASLVSGCQPCILHQTEHALKLGASVQEILETCAVAISLGGTMAGGETSRVISYLKSRQVI